MFRGITIGLLMLFPLVGMAADPTVAITNLVADSCFNNGSGGTCEVTADCVDPTVKVDARACQSDDACRRTGVACDAVQSCSVIDPNATCEVVDGQNECVLANQVCGASGQCFTDCDKTLDCSGAGDTYVCWRADPTDARGLCYSTDLVCRNRVCVFDGGVAGGEAGASPRSIPVNLTLTDDKSRKLTLRFAALWTLPDPTGETCPDGNDATCADERLACEGGQCVVKTCTGDDDCGGQAVCENERCVIRGTSGYAVDYAFPNDCAAGQPCTRNTTDFEIPSFMIEDSPNATINVAIVEACEPEPVNPAACTACLVDADCGIGRGCGPDGACIDLYEGNMPCGGLIACPGDDVCVDGVCYAESTTPDSDGLGCRSAFHCAAAATEPSCNVDLDCALGSTCYHGTCIDLTGGLGACGDTGRQCPAESTCDNGLCRENGQPECTDDSPCTGIGDICLKGVCLDTSDTGLFACERGVCIQKACASDDQCQGDREISGTAACVRGTCVDLDLKAACNADQTCVIDKCLANNLCEQFDDVVTGVDFQLDRKAPFVDLNPATLETAATTLEACADQDVEETQLLERGWILATDDQTAEPDIDLLDPTPPEGCTIRHIVRASDSCENIQDVTFLSYKAPAQGDLVLQVRGYQCPNEGLCNTTNADPIGNDQLVSRAVALLDKGTIDNPPFTQLGCDVVQRATLINNDRFDGTCPPQPTEPKPSGFCSNCQAHADCGLGSSCYNGTCIDLNKAEGVCGAPPNRACADGEVCIDGVCLIRGEPSCIEDVCTDTGIPECAGDDDCQGARVCLTGICIHPVDDLPCGVDEICRNARCIATAPKCTVCTGDNECELGWSCFEGTCIDLKKGAPACDDAVPARACPNGFSCTDGVCLLGGNPQCDQDAQCPVNGSRCVRGVCIQPDDDAACPSDQICQVDTCVPADGNAACTRDAECPGRQQCLQNECYEPMQCEADLDCLGSRFCSDGQCTSPCQIYAGDPIERAGSWTVKGELAGCDNVPVISEWTVRILERPEPVLGGPEFNGTNYVVKQGDPLVLDASGTQTPDTVSIVEYAWDANGRDGYEAGPGGNPCNTDNDCRGGIVDEQRVGESCEPEQADTDCAQPGAQCFCRLLCDNDADCRQLPGSPQSCFDGYCRTEVFPGNQPQYTFDTGSSGTYPVRLRVTDNLGASSAVRFNVVVNDVEPDCELGPDYVVDEGDELQFRTDGISAGHPDEPILFYGWNFGDSPDGNTGREQTHVFDIVPGNAPPNDTYTVTVTLRDIDTPLDDPVLCYVNVTVRDVDPIIEGIDILNPQAQVEGSVVQFDSRFQGRAADPIERFTWTATCRDEPDNPCNQLASPPPVQSNSDDAGGRGNEPFLSRLDLRFSEHGRYDVCLTLTDEDSDSETTCQPITITDVDPIASIEGPMETDQGTEERFNLRGTIAGSSADALKEVRVDWGDGSQVQTLAVNGVVGCTLETLKNPGRDCWLNHAYAEDGPKTITVRAIDEDSAAVATHTITVRDAQPTARIDLDCDTYPNCPEQFDEGKSIRFSAANSRPGSELDPIAKYIWDFGDGTQVERAPGQLTVTHTYADNGGYLVTLTVVDQDLSQATDTFEVIVDNIAPEVTMVPATGATKVALGESIQFLAIGQGTPLPSDGQVRVLAVIDDVPADVPPTGVISAEWNVGDNGQVRRGTSATYTYGDLGRKTVTFNIQDSDGARAACIGPNGDAEIDNCKFTVEVTPAPPILVGPAEVEAIEGQETEFTVRVTAPPVGEGVYGDLTVRTEGGLTGAIIDVSEQQEPEGGGAPYIEVSVKWTPNFYEAPVIRPFQVTGFANNTSRSHTVGIRVVEGGTPRLTTLSGQANLALLTFYDYGLDANSQQLKLVPTAPIPIGLGVGQLAAGPEGRYIWATVPGSNRVAVVDAAPGGRGLVRRVPVGQTPTAIVMGGAGLPSGARIWVANQGDNSISVIDPVLMKLDYAEGNTRTTFDLPGIDGPSDMVWLPAGFDDLDAPRLVVITRHSGHIAVIDPQKVISGEILRAVTKKYQIGAMLNRIVADPVSGELLVSDVKARRVYRVRASELVADQNPRIDNVSLDSAARDMLVNRYVDDNSGAELSTIVIATDDGIYELDGDEVAPLNNFATAMTTVSRQAIVDGAIALMSSSGIIKHVRQEDLTVNVPRPSSVSTGDRLVLRMLMFISPR
ncbi:MAG: PKD domain-containing protein [Myxococcota bacterium]|nr:PKD domain-containing protein [Myxococcota bacterium]